MSNEDRINYSSHNAWSAKYLLPKKPPSSFIYLNYDYVMSRLQKLQVLETKNVLFAFTR